MRCKRTYALKNRFDMMKMNKCDHLILNHADPLLLLTHYPFSSNWPIIIKCVYPIGASLGYKLFWYLMVSQWLGSVIILLGISWSFRSTDQSENKLEIGRGAYRFQFYLSFVALSLSKSSPLMANLWTFSSLFGNILGIGITVGKIKEGQCHISAS